MLKGEVDPFDQMIIEAARVLFPELYTSLRRQQSFGYTAADEILVNIKSTCPDISDDDKNAAEGLVKTLLRWERASAKPISDPRYHSRYFSYAVTPEDISDGELSRLLELAGKREQDDVDNAVRTLARDRLAVLAERLQSPALIESLDLSRADRLALALAQIGDLLPTGLPIIDQDLACTVGVAVAKLVSHLMDLRKYNGRQVAASVIQHATPLPFAVVIYRELGRLAQAYREQGETTFEHWDELRDLLRERIKIDAQTRPPYDVYLANDARWLLQFWRNSEPAEENAWLEGRLREHPSESEKLLSLFPEQHINYQFIGELAAPPVIVEALKHHWGDALGNPTQDSSGIRSAHEFLEAHYAKNPVPNEVSPGS